MSALYKVVSKDEVVRFISDCLSKAGANSEESKIVAHHLMTADYRGHFSHGMNRVDMYVQDLLSGRTNPDGKPEIVNDFQATALVDGRNGLGHVIGKFCMDLAIKKAETFGIGMVSVHGSNHYGICGYYSLMAAEKGLIGFSCTNTSPIMNPTRSKRAALGTNPFSLAMQTQDGGDEFVLDMATTAVAVGKIEVALNKGEEIPGGWALGANGQPTKDPREAFETGNLLPLGGTEETSGYKGYGLSAMVEILCGVLSGSRFGKNIRSWRLPEGVADLGQCFMVINPEVFAPGAGQRLGALLEQLRALPTADDAPGPVLVAGDPERSFMEQVDRQGGLQYHQNQIKICDEMAHTLGVTPLRFI